MVIILQTKPTYKVLFMDRQHDKCTHWLAGIQFLDSLSILMLRQDVVLNLTAIGMLSFDLVPLLDVGNLRSIKIYIELAVRIIYIDTHIHKYQQWPGETCRVYCIFQYFNENSLVFVHLLFNIHM